MWKHQPSGVVSSITKAPMSFSNMSMEKASVEKLDGVNPEAVEKDVHVDIKELYFLMMHFLSSGPCQKTFGLFCEELAEHQLLPRRFHAWYSRSGASSVSNCIDGVSLPLNYDQLVKRYAHIEKDHLVRLMRQLFLHISSPVLANVGGKPNAADVPTLLGSGSFSLLDSGKASDKQVKHLPVHLHWPYTHADQFHGLSLREIGGGFAKHHRAPSVRAACYAIAKPSTMVQKMQNTKKIRGHRNAVYCAIFDRSGRYVITGSDDRLVKIWSMETAFCLASCRGHEGDITDLAVSSNNAVVASASNDFAIRVWRLPDGMPISVLRGHTGAVTAIAFSPRPSTQYHLLSSSDDGTCRIWDARYSQCCLRIYVPKALDAVTGKMNGSSGNGSSSSSTVQNNQILCCAFNSNGTVFVTGSSDTYARVWIACRSNADESAQPIHEIDVLAGHENDVNYVQFSGCAVTPKISTPEALREDHIPKFKNSWYSHDNIVTCSRDGSAIIWAPKSRRSHGKPMRWIKSYHLKVPPPPLPPQPPRGGPRQRILPTPRGVNMIMWSLDNRFVLAAIMDCRICVWNAGDGSLVHSLTGHTESSYVLDVHPFNPRIAMSAGYDGKTIIWDIWEGIPIRTYEIGRFKLVDGKFSTDGTSIVLSDDVGQIYLLNTGQGDSQKDAKYDQFFLGDYRPLIRDTSGNVVDQETQLNPYKRNIQDPLCDSSMVPYPEPYQTMFQRRRLGALGMEWRPSSLRFAIGPDINLGQDYQMPPLEDLDRIIEPLPEFIDAIYWEPDNEIVSDDNDSEYNVTEEASEAEQVSIGSGSSSEHDCSENSDVEHSQKDRLRRSRRKKHKFEADLSTSSGRRVKKRNLDERAGPTSRNGTKKLKSGRKISKKKSSKAHTSRPQRIAARNAINMFSKYTGESTDEEHDDDESASYTSDSDMELQESNIQSDMSDRLMQNVTEEDDKDKRLALVDEKNAANPHDVPESQDGAGSRRKLVFKISLRDSKKPVSSEEDKLNDKNLANIAKDQENRIHLSRDSGSSSISVAEPSQNQMEGDIADGGQAQKIEDIVEESVRNDGNRIKWGEIKIRSSKRLKLEDATLDDTCIAENDASLDACKESRNDSKGDDEKFRNDMLQHQDGAQNEDFVPPKLEINSLFESSPPLNIQSKHNAPRSSYHATAEGADLVRSQPKIRTLKITTKGIFGGPGTSSEMKPSYLEQNEALNVLEKDESKLIFPYEVHQMERSHKVGASTDNSYDDSEHDTSSAVKYEDSEDDLSEDSADAIRRTRSMKMKATSREPNVIIHNFRKRDRREFVGTSKNPGKDVMLEEKMSRSKKVSKTSRNNGVGNYDNDIGRSTERKLKYPVKKPSWLILPKHWEAYSYVPQQGDEVVYLRQGHQEFIESTSTKEKGPWNSIKGLRATEVCKVENLVYSTVPAGDSCCKLTLRFIDPSSKAYEKTFKFTLPELSNFPEFIVEKTRFDDAVSRSWAPNDKCLLWWSNGEEGGKWWNGIIDSELAKAPEFPDSPWERYYILYYDAEPSDHQNHSPWELHDPDVPSWKHPCLDSGIRDALLSSFSKLERSVKNQDYYGIQKFNEASQKLDFVNRFPVPLYPELIQARLENDYYRSFEAVKHDIQVMMENARSYFKNADLSRRMKRLSEWYTRKLSELEDFV